MHRGVAIGAEKVSHDIPTSLYHTISYTLIVLGQPFLTLFLGPIGHQRLDVTRRPRYFGVRHINSHKNLLALRVAAVRVVAVRVKSDTLKNLRAMPGPDVPCIAQPRVAQPFLGVAG